MFPKDSGIVGMVSDVPVTTMLPTAHIDDIPSIAQLLLNAAVDITTLLDQDELGTKE